MKAKEVMVENISTASQDESVSVAANRMRDESVGCLVIVADAAVKGIITDRDLLDCTAQGHNPQECPLSSHMSPKVVTTTPDADLLKVTQLMADWQVKRIPVIQNDSLVGLISFADISIVMDQRAQDLWDELIQLARMVRAGARHQRGRRTGDSVAQPSITR